MLAYAITEPLNQVSARQTLSMALSSAGALAIDIGTNKPNRNTIIDWLQRSADAILAMYRVERLAQDQIHVGQQTPDHGFAVARNYDD